MISTGEYICMYIQPEKEFLIDYNIQVSKISNGKTYLC